MSLTFCLMGRFWLRLLVSSPPLFTQLLDVTIYLMCRWHWDLRQSGWHFTWHACLSDLPINMKWILIVGLVRACHVRVNWLPPWYISHMHLTADSIHTAASTLWHPFFFTTSNSDWFYGIICGISTKQELLREKQISALANFVSQLIVYFMTSIDAITLT